MFSIHAFAIMFFKMYIQVKMKIYTKSIIFFFIISVSDHRTAKQGKASTPSPKLSMKESEFQQLIENVFNITLEEVINCPYRQSSEQGKKIITLSNLVNNNNIVKTEMLSVMSSEFSTIVQSSESNVNIDMTANERIFHHFYQMTSDKSVQSRLKNSLANLPDVHLYPCKQFLAVFQHSMLQNFITERAKLYTKKASEPTKMSDTDQSIIFYIAGFMISALKKKTIKGKSDKHRELLHQTESLVSCATSAKSEFVVKFAEWTNKLNRGGLIIPSDNFFLLVRELENSYRKYVDLNNITCLTLDRTYIVVKLLDDFLVNYYWDKLCQPSETKDLLLENCIKLFLSVRGHSTARHIKLLITEKNESKKSLRQNLRDKSNKS